MSGSSFQWTPESLRATIGDETKLRTVFERANVTGTGTIRGEQAVAFLRPSGLRDGELSKIWKASTRGTGALSSPSELGQCLELVARALELEMPSEGMTTPSGEKSGFGGTPRTPASASAATVHAAPMTEAERKKYFGHFRTIDAEGKGNVSVDTAVKFLSKAALPLLSVQLCVARATRGGSSVDRDAFAVAMHDVYALIRAQGKTPVTPVATPSAPVAALTNDTSSSAADDNFFSSMGPPKQGATALEATSPMSFNEALPIAQYDDATRLEREAEMKTQSAKREKEAAEAAQAAADARIARATRAIEAADEDIAAARKAVERAEEEAERRKRDATARLDAARKQHAELVQREGTVKREAMEAIAAKKTQYELTVSEYERLKAQVANASAVAALPVKAMQDKLTKIEEETRAIKMQTDKAAADASQALMKRAVEVAKADRAKAAALRELEAVSSKLEMEKSRIEKQLESLQAEIESCIAKREAKSAAHPGLMDDLHDKLQKYKADAAKENEQTSKAIAECEQESSDLKATIALAKAELEAVQSAMDSDLATHKVQLEEKRTAHQEVAEAVRQALERRRKLAESQALEISALNDKVVEAETALQMEDAAMDAQEQTHQEEMNAKESALAELNAKIDSTRSQMELNYLASQKALSDVEAQIDAAEAKFQEQQEERDLGLEKLKLEHDDLEEKLAIAKEKQEENVRDKADNDVIIASKRAELQELRELVSQESSRIEREIAETQEEFSVVKAALDAERNALNAALEKLRETLPKSAAFVAQIQALRSSGDRYEIYKTEAEDTAEKAIATYEEIMKRLETVALEEAEGAAGDEEDIVLDSAHSALAHALEVSSTNFEPEPKHERLPSFVDFEVSPVAGTKSGAFDTDFDLEPFDETDAFAAPSARGDDVFGSAPAEDAFAPMGESESFIPMDESDLFAPAGESDAFDTTAFETEPAADRQFRSFSMDEPEPELKDPEPMASSGALVASSAPHENSFSAFEEFKPESTDDVYGVSLECSGADVTSDEKRPPPEDLFAATQTKSIDGSDTFTTFDNEAFTSNADEQWQNDFAVSPPREEVSWNPDESTDDAFMTAQKPPSGFDDGFDAPEANENDSVFATPSAALTFQGSMFGASEEGSAAPTTPMDDYADAQEEMDETEELGPIPPDDMSRSNAAWEKLRGDANSEGVTGAQIVAIATKTGLENSDLAIIWNISCTPGASELSMYDFALFMHFLKHRVNGGQLPRQEEVDLTKRAYLLGVSETDLEPPSPAAMIHAETAETTRAETRQEPSSPARGPSSASRLRVHVESVANVKDAPKMSSTHFSITVVDVDGTALEPPQNTPIGAQVTSEGVIRVQGGVVLNSVPANWPEGSAVVLELRHYKEKEKKMSTRCWSYMEKESVRPGLFGLPLAVKPTDVRRKKVKLYNAGNPDLKVRFSLVDDE